MRPPTVRLLSLLVPFLTTLAPPAHADPEPAASADDFVDRIGVATHWGYTDTPYGFAYDKVKALLGASGIRHVRNGYHAREWDLYQSHGIKTTVIFGPSAQPPGEQVKVLDDKAAMVDMIEGPNEVDIFATSSNYQGKVFPAGARAYQDDLYAAVKADPALRHLRVIAPSTARMDGNLKLAPLRSFDYLVMHSYAGGAMPSISLEGGMVSNILNASRILGTGAVVKPIVVTESGYHTALQADMTLGGVQPGVSEAAQAKYIPRHFAEYFNAGIVRTITYEFINEFPNEATNAEASFGIVRRDLTPKPAYTALKNLISILQDAAWNPATRTWNHRTAPLRSLDYTLTGNTSHVHHTLLQQSNGDFMLLLWQEVSSFDTKTKRDIPNAAAPVTLTFNTGTQAAAAYLPGSGAQPVTTYRSPRSLQLNVPDEVMVVLLTPRRSTTASVATPSNVTESATGNTITLAWNSAPRGARVDGYFVSRLGRYLGFMRGTSFTDSNLSPEMGYTYEIRACDATGNVSQPVTRVVMTKALYPDLIVTDFSWTPANPTAGAAVTFSATIKNVGNGPTPVGVVHGVLFQVDGVNANWSDTFHDALPPGATRTLTANNGAHGTATWIAVAGPHTVSAHVDDVNRINESTKTNNRVEKVLTVGP